MKRATIIFLALIFCLTANCAKLRNSIYIFDCTRSMMGDAAKNIPDIWESTKSDLKARIGREPDDARIVIIPFQSTPHPAIIFERKDFDWDKVNSRLENYIKSLTNTNICDSWTAGEEYIDLTRNNYIYLMTDGVDTDPARRVKFVEVLRRFCIRNYPDTHGFYVRLSDNAMVEDNVKDIIDGCDDIDIVSPGDRTDFGGFDRRVININTHELPCIRIFDFSDHGTFKATASSDDPNFKVSVADGKIAGGILRIKIESAYGDDKAKLFETLGDENYEFDITVNSDDIYIINPVIEVNVVNRPERVLEFRGLSHEEDDLGTGIWHGAFLFSAASDPDTLSIDLAPAFNDEARRDRSSARFRLSANSGSDSFTLLINGRETADSTFVISAADDPAHAIVSLIFAPGCEDTDVNITLTEISSTALDRIGDTPCRDFSHSLRAACESEMNPLAKALMWAAIAICGALLLWFALLKRRIFPPISRITTVNVTRPYLSQRRVRGARLVVFSDKPVRQSFINRLFTGRIISEVNPVWTSRCEMRHASKGVRFSCPDRSMVASPSAVMSKFNEYTIMKTDGSGRDITIKTM